MPKVSQRELRRLFNSHNIWDRVEAGEFTLRLLYCGEPSIPMPHGTKSLRQAIFDGRTKIAEVHYYQLPGGKIGASGRPDPKVLFLDGEHYWL